MPSADKSRRFDDLFNFVHDPATLLVAFDRVAGAEEEPDFVPAASPRVRRSPFPNPGTPVCSSTPEVLRADARAYGTSVPVDASANLKLIAFEP